MWFKVISLFVGSIIALMMTRQRIYELRKKDKSYMEPMMIGFEWCVVVAFGTGTILLFWKTIAILSAALTT